MKTFKTISIILTICSAVAACQSNNEPVEQMPDAAVSHPDAPKPPVDAPPPPLLGYGAHCTMPSQCQSGMCIGNGVCSRSCSVDVAADCKDVNAFCVPLAGGGDGCYGTIVTGSDTDDAVLHTGDSVMRTLTPLNDADLFIVHLDVLGTTVITGTPQAGIDLQLEAYDMIGQQIGIANNGGASAVETETTNVTQLGGYVFIVVRNVGTSTGTYTLSNMHTTTATAQLAPAVELAHHDATTSL